MKNSLVVPSFEHMRNINVLGGFFIHSSFKNYNNVTLLKISAPWDQKLSKKFYLQWITYCSDFRYESNGIFVLGVGFFFLQTNFDFLTSRF